jgi:hypothetical protein
MDFKERYPLLWQFFAGYFGAYEEEFTDEELASSYRDDVGESELLHRTRAELGDLLHQQAHWQQAADEANRYFATPEQMHHWLLMIQQRLQATN